MFNSIARRSRLVATITVSSMVSVAFLPGILSSSASTVHTGPAATAKSVGISLTNFDATELAKYHVTSSSILGGLKEELAVPKSWITKANQEGTVDVLMDATTAQAAPFVQAFEERYPGIKVNYTYGSATAARVTNPLVAFEQGKFTTDVLAGATAEIGQYNLYHFNIKETDLPMWKLVPNSAKATQGNWIGYGTKYWGIGYNTTAIPKSQLPKTWKDILTDPAFRNGSLGILDRPNLFLEELAGTYGLSWANNFENTLFHTVKPALDAGSIGATGQLLANKTYSALLPMASYLAATTAATGAPVSWYTPLPPVQNVSDMEITADAQHPYAAKIWTNWFASEEGEFADWAAQDVTPIMPAMLKGHLSLFIPYASEISTHKTATMPPGQMENLQSSIGNSFSALWAGGS